MNRVCDLTRGTRPRRDERAVGLRRRGEVVEYARGRVSDGRQTGVRVPAVNGGDPTGERVADVDYQGNVHLTQFWQGYSLGNVRDRSFGAIWDDETNPLLRRFGTAKTSHRAVRRLSLRRGLPRCVQTPRAHRRRRPVCPGPAVLPARRGDTSAGAVDTGENSPASWISAD